MKNKYHFDLLTVHSNGVTAAARRELKEDFKKVKEGFSFLDHHIFQLEKKPKSHCKNVKMALAARFINHLFSYIFLIERGLFLDAINCARSAMETTAFYWLICRDPERASLYDGAESPRPVDVRKMLEKLSIDTEELRDMYGVLSSISHVGNMSDNLQINWKEMGKDGQLLIGGGSNLQLQKEMLQAMPAYVRFFLKEDQDYEINTSNRDQGVGVT